MSEEQGSVVVREASLFWQWLKRMASLVRKASIKASVHVLRFVLAADAAYHEQVIERIQGVVNKLENADGQSVPSDSSEV